MPHRVYPCGAGRDKLSRCFCEWRYSMSKAISSEIIYEIGKMKFIVTPVYKNEGETIYDILLRLILADFGLE